MRASTMLLAVLWIKIVATLILWAAPLLLLPAARIRRIGIPMPEPMLFIRLLGAAYTALLVGYLLGSFNLSRNQDITEIVWIGIVSNGLAWVMLTYFGVIGTWPCMERPRSFVHVVVGDDDRRHHDWPTR
jgi:hypothetical protein